MKNKWIILLPCLLLSIYAAALKPKKEYRAMPDAASFPGWKDITMETTDHYKIAAWQLPPKGTDRHISIIVAGGDAGNMSNFLPLAFALTSHGFTVITFDYRGFGSSGDFPVDTAHLYYNEFGEDLKAVVQWSKMQMPGNKTAVYALSMGTIITTRVWKDIKPDCFIGESFVVNPTIVQQRLFAMKGRTFFLPEDAAFHPLKIAELPGKLLLFAGSQDMITSVTDVKTLQLQHPGAIVKVFEGGHGGGFSAMMSNEKDGDYVDAIIDFTSK